MSFNLWKGTESEFTHEHQQVKSLIQILRGWSLKTDTNVHLLTNYYVNGEEIDATVILPNAIVVIDLKSGSGLIDGGENGDWICKTKDGKDFIVNEGRKNPLHQARSKRFAIINYLEERKESIFHLQKADQVSFEHTSSYLLFDDSIKWNNDELPHGIKMWFDVLSIDQLPEKLSFLKSKKLSLTKNEAIKIPTLLRLNHVDEKITQVNPINIVKHALKENVIENEQYITQQYKYAVGIDLGTSVSSLCYIDLGDSKNKVHELPVTQLFASKREVVDKKVPSVVYITGSSIYIGKGAEEKKYSSIRDCNVFYSAKSQLGRKYIYHLSKSVDITYPYQVSGLILNTLISAFKDKVSESLEKCKFVITVPASFGGSQRSDTIKAINQTNLPRVEGMLVDEPNAAFIGYINSLKQFDVPEGSKALVFDMGGGTTDISILEINSLKGDAMDIRNIAVSRYDLLGGDDIDAHIANEFLYPKFLEQNGITDNEFSFSEKEKMIKSKLKKIAKALKESIVDKLNWYLAQNDWSPNKPIDWSALKDKADLIITMPDEEISGITKKYKMNGLELDCKSFLKLIHPFVTTNISVEKQSESYNKISIFSLIKSIMEISKINKENIDFILPIGGSPKNPIILEALNKYFKSGTILLPNEEEMDLLVSKGAAYYAKEIAVKSKIPISPVTPDKIGILTKDDSFSTIIKSGVEVPYPVKDDTFVESEVFIIPNNSKKVTIPICVGDKSRIYQIVSLDKDELDSSIKLGMRLDKDKILNMNIVSGGSIIPYVFENPITVYKSANYNINLVNDSHYEYCKSHVDNDDSVLEKQFKYAVTLKEAKRYSEAIEHFEKLMNNSKDVNIKDDSLFNAGYCACVLKHNEKAIKYYQLFLDKYPTSSITKFNLGLIYKSTGQKEKAEAVWESSIKDENAAYVTYIYLGIEMIKTGNNSEKAHKYLSDGITNILNKENKSISDMISLVNAYKVLDDKDNVQKWNMEYEKLMKDSILDYNPNELLRQEIEEVSI